MRRNRGPYNAKAARAKRPCPIWWDAFLRDTMHLDAQGVGAYLLVLGAMWGRESCDLPNDDRKLAVIARVPIKAWKSHVGATIRGFLSVDQNGNLFSKRLREEADYAEKQLQAQSDRKSSKGDDNPLKSNGTGATADTSADTSADKGRKSRSRAPKSDSEGDFFGRGTGNRSRSVESFSNPLTSNDPVSTADTSADEPRTDRGTIRGDILPKNPTLRVESSASDPTTPREARTADADARVDPFAGLQQPPVEFHDRVIAAIGIDPSREASAKWFTSGEQWIARRWTNDLGLSEGDVLTVLADVRSRANGRSIGTLKYFDPAMQEAAGRKAAEPLKPITSSSTSQPGADPDIERWNRIRARYETAEETSK